MNIDWTAESQKQVSVADCYFINNHRDSVELICQDSVEPYPKIDNCFASLFQANSTEIKKFLTKLKLLKVKKNCELHHVDSHIHLFDGPMYHTCQI